MFAVVTVRVDARDGDQGDEREHKQKFEVHSGGERATRVEQLANWSGKKMLDFNSTRTFIHAARRCPSNRRAYSTRFYEQRLQQTAQNSLHMQTAAAAHCRVAMLQTLHDPIACAHARREVVKRHHFLQPKVVTTMSLIASIMRRRSTVMSAQSHPNSTTAAIARHNRSLFFASLTARLD